ncbi:MAG TPA: ERF family protein, partial [Actinomycetota bacterium]|nr:ERF family protein [Actinomycetota bacterium]
MPATAEPAQFSAVLESIEPADQFTFTAPRWTPEEVRAWFAEVPTEVATVPRVLAPLHILLPILKRYVGPIGKTGQMKAQVKDGEKKGPEYKFRQIEDILNEAHGPLCDLGINWRKVAVVRHELKANGKAETCVMEVIYELVGPLGDTVRSVAVGEAVDFGSDKATNKADTCARKNMLVDLLQLATEDPDSERPDRVDERPEVQKAKPADAVAIVKRVGALSDGAKAEVKEWAGERGITVIPRELTAGDVTKLGAFLTAIEKRERELAEAEANTDGAIIGAGTGAPTDTVQEAVDKLEEAVDKAKEARSRHPQPSSRAAGQAPAGMRTPAAMEADTDKAPAPAAPTGEAAQDAAGDTDAETINEQAQATLVAEIEKLRQADQAKLVEVGAWATDQGMDITVANLPNLTTQEFTILMRAIRNALRSGTVGTAKKAASRTTKKAAAKPAPPAGPTEEEQTARLALRAELVGRAELLTEELQVRFLTQLAEASGPTGVDLGAAIETCPPAWDGWLAAAIEKLEDE